MKEETDSNDKQLEQARRELAEANERLGRHSITEQDIIRRNRAERIVKELEGRGR